MILRAATSNANDGLIIAGNAADPDIDGMIDALGTQPANPAAVVTGLTAHAAFWDGVDGLLSYRGDGSRILTNVATIKKLAELQIGTNGPLLVDRYGDGVLRASARMPAGTNAFHNYVLFKPQATGYAVNPIWNGIAFIRDVYTNARAGQTCDNRPHACQLQAGTHGRPRPGQVRHRIADAAFREMGSPFQRNAA